MKNLEKVFTNKLCIFLFLISLSLFILFEFLIFDIFFIFILIFYGICILLYFISTKMFINIKNKNITECVFFLASSLCLILAGLTDIDYNFFGSPQQIIDFLPENTSDLNFMLCTFLSIALIIRSIIKKRKSKE